MKRGEAAAAGVPDGAEVPGFSPAEASPVAAEFSARWQHMVETINRRGVLRISIPACCPVVAVRWGRREACKVASCARAPQPTGKWARALAMHLPA